jgi:hypothetical protein
MYMDTDNTRKSGNNRVGRLINMVENTKLFMLIVFASSKMSPVSPCAVYRIFIAPTTAGTITAKIAK